jgi:uncharacterized protein with von Willebrand factor type A (vWA) domain
MEERLLKFISALRHAGVRISLSESADAFHAIEELGIRDRDIFRVGIRSTLVKDAVDIPIFEELFPLFFRSSSSPLLLDISEALTPEELEMINDTLGMFNDHLRRAIDRLLYGKHLTMEELNRQGRLVGLNNIENLHYHDWIVNRMIRALGFRNLEQALLELLDLLKQMGFNEDRIKQIITQLRLNKRATENQISQYVGQRIAENMSEHPHEEGVDGLYDRNFGTLTDAEMEQLRKEVSRMTAALRTKVALRQKRAKNGRLDAKSTIRVNLKHGNVPMVIKRKGRHLKPKMVVICDISTSMRFCSELMLSMIHAMQDHISKMHAFVFIDHLEYISPEFQGKRVREAIYDVLDKMPAGYYNTDFGYCLTNFAHDYLETIDSRTTLIIVGDGRNNYCDPRIDLFKQISRRSRKTIWLNPEAPSIWGTGDSDMLDYHPICDVVLQVGTLVELEKAVDKLLSSPT